jgi:hypothetical protein
MRVSIRNAITSLPLTSLSMPIDRKPMSDMGVEHMQPTTRIIEDPNPEESLNGLV